MRERLKKRLLTKNLSVFRILPYTVEQLIIHLESQFISGMSWSNYGKWHIDHKIPDSHFDYKSINDEEFRHCWSLDNLQPLWARDNIKKGNKICV